MPVLPGQHFVHSSEVGWQGWREVTEKKGDFFLSIPFMFKIRWRELRGDGASSGLSSQ